MNNFFKNFFHHNIFNDYANNDIIDMYNNNIDNHKSNFSYSYSSNNMYINQNGKIIKGQQQQFKDSNGNIKDKFSRTIDNKTIVEKTDGIKYNRNFYGLEPEDKISFDNEWERFNRKLRLTPQVIYPINNRWNINYDKSIK
tara:strand:+ start:112 stop:534 length:423 start_codon:yes stop_codon:yes gene_type:complete